MGFAGDTVEDTCNRGAGTRCRFRGCRFRGCRFHGCRFRGGRFPGAGGQER
ncbi:MAG: pentapeptide repeat-containing protein [Mycobacterium sp.]|nr:pentapeptide repeat-containing protein [Mycobacterium sp.]